VEISRVLSEKHILDWVNPQHRNAKAVEHLKRNFTHNNPFAHVVLENFFNENKIAELLQELTKEEFLEKESDLFKFMQTHDFATSASKELQEFRRFLCSDAFVSYMEAVTQTKLKTGAIDIAGSLYQNTDYLLPHDDQLESRKIAFMIYLSSLEARDGGKLILYRTKGKIPREEEKAIIPQFNTFVFFKVSEKSFHEVEEVIINKQRITIGGWFHGEHHKSKLPHARKY